MERIKQIILLAVLVVAVAGCGVKQVSCPVPDEQRHLLEKREQCPEGVRPTTEDLCKIDCSPYLEEPRKMEACLNINLLSAEEAEEQLQDLVKGLEGKGKQ